MMQPGQVMGKHAAAHQQHGDGADHPEPADHPGQRGHQPGPGQGQGPGHRTAQSLTKTDQTKPHIVHAHNQRHNAIHPDGGQHGNQAHHHDLQQQPLLDHRAQGDHHDLDGEDEIGANCGLHLGRLHTQQFLRITRCFRRRPTMFLMREEMDHLFHPFK